MDVIEHWRDNNNKDEYFHEGTLGYNFITTLRRVTDTNRQLEALLFKLREKSTAIHTDNEIIEDLVKKLLPSTEKKQGSQSTSSEVTRAR